MLSVNDNEYIFIEKFRPKTIDDLIVPQKLKEQMQEWVRDGEIPNLLLSSRTPGTGKTSMTHTLINEVGADALFINASLESNIDLLRNKIQGFVSTASFNGNAKIIVLDEADFLNANSTQPALRGFIEQFSKNARFILTCNYPNKLIEPLRDRLILIDFDEMMQKNKKELVTATFLRNQEVLKHEKIEYEKEDLIWLIRHFYPSNRLILNKMQQMTQNGKLSINKDDIDTDTLNSEIINELLNGGFEELRINCAKLPDPSAIFLTIFERIEDFPKEFRPQIIITVARYQSYDASVRDRHINSLACCLEVQQILN